MIFKDLDFDTTMTEEDGYIATSDMSMELVDKTGHQPDDDGICDIQIELHVHLFEIWKLLKSISE